MAAGLGIKKTFYLLMPFFVLGCSNSIGEPSANQAMAQVPVRILVNNRDREQNFVPFEMGPVTCGDGTVVPVRSVIRKVDDWTRFQASVESMCLGKQ